MHFDGFLPQISIGSFSFPTYFLVISLACCLVLVFFVKRTEQAGLKVATALDLSLVIMLFGFLGARLMHVLFEDFAFYRANPVNIFYFWNGGYVFLGGAVLAAFGSWLLLRIRKEACLVWFDIFAPVGAFGYAMGRVACWLTGCCFGAMCTLPSGFSFRHPTQLYAVIWESAVCLVLLQIEKKRARSLRPGVLFSIWVFLHACGRIGMELLRADYRGPQPLGLSVAIWICLGLLLWSIWFNIRRRSLKS